MPNGFTYSIRGIAQAFMRSMAETGVTANAALEQLRKSDLGYRRTDFLNDYSQYVYAVEQHDTMRHVAMNKRPAPENYAIMRYGRPGKAFKYVVQVNMTHRTTGESRSMYTNITSDSQLTHGQVRESAFDSMYSYLDQSEFDIDSINMSEAWATPEAEL